MQTLKIFFDTIIYHTIYGLNDGGGFSAYLRNFFFPSTYPDTIFLKSCRFYIILYSENTSRLNRLICVFFLPSTYADIIFLKSCRFCLVSYKEKEVGLNRLICGILLFLPPIQRLIFKLMVIFALFCS